MSNESRIAASVVPGPCKMIGDSHFGLQISLAIRSRAPESLVVALVLAFTFQCSSLLHAATSIDAVNKSAYGADIGWTDFRGNTNSGVVIGEFVCSGYLYAANIGWI